MSDKDLKLNCVLSDISVMGTEVYRFSIIPLTQNSIDFSRYGYAITKCIRNVETYPTGGKFLLTFEPDKIPSTIEIDGIKFDLRDPKIESLSPENDSHIRLVRDIISKQVKKQLNILGYTMEDQNTLYKPEFTQTLNIESHPAVEYQIQMTPTGKIMIFIDIKRRWVCPLLKFRDSLQRYTDIEKNEILKGKEVMVHLSSDKLQSMTIVDYIDERQSNYHLNIEGYPTIYDYWSNPPKNQSFKIESIKRKIKYTPDRNDRGIVKVSKENLILDYPIQVLRLKLDLADPELLELLDLTAEKCLLSSVEREREIDEIFKHITNIEYKFNTISLNFKSETNPKWGVITELIKEGYELIKLDSPDLLLGNKKKIKFQPKSFEINKALRESGPYSGEKNIVLDMICPINTEKNVIDTFYQQIIKLYSEHNFGIITRGEVIRSTSEHIAYGANAVNYLYGLKDKGADISQHFFFGVLPTENQDQCHHSLNNELYKIGVPSKCMRYLNFKQIAPSKISYHLYSIMSNIYERMLKPGEATWLLLNKAGNNPNSIIKQYSDVQNKKDDDNYTTIFIGFDVSRISGRSEVASYASICEPHGRVINVKDMNFKGEYLSENDIRDIINEVMREYDKIKRELNLKIIDEIVFFKDGDTKGAISKNAIENGLMSVKHDLVTAGRTSENLKLIYATVKKRIIHRFFSNVSIIPEGLCLINRKFKNPQSIIISTTPLSSNTTQSPNMITILLSIGELDSTRIYRLSKEYHDLRFLHWETWRIQPGTALPLHIVQHKAKQLGYKYDTAYIPK